MSESEGAAASEPADEVAGRKRWLRLAGLKRETRFGIAIVLSFAILMAVLIGNRPGSPKEKTKSETKLDVAQAKAKTKAPEKPGSAESSPPPVTQIPAPPRNQLAASEPPSGSLPPAPVEPGPDLSATDPLEAPPGPAEVPATSPASEQATVASASDSPPPAPAAQPSVEEPRPSPDLGPPPAPVAASAAIPPSGIPLAESTSPPSVTQAATTAMNPPAAEAPNAPAPSPQPELPPSTTPSPAAESPSPGPVSPAELGIAGRPAPVDDAPPRPLPSNLVERARMPQVGADWIPVPNAGKNLVSDLDPAPSTAARGPAPTRLAAAALPASAPEPTSAASADLDPIEPARHVVKSGENFWTISKLYYGSARYYKALWAANRDRVVAPDKLVVGMTIRVPPPEALDRSLIEVAPPGGTTPPSDERPSRAASRGSRSRGPSDVELALPVGRPPRRTRDAGGVADAQSEVSYPTHEVREHETLRSIARDTLGDARRAGEILDMNRDAITDPKRLTPGQRLVLPDDAQLSRASTRSRN